MRGGQDGPAVVRTRLQHGLDVPELGGGHEDRAEAALRQALRIAPRPREDALRHLRHDCACAQARTHPLRGARA